MCELAQVRSLLGWGNYLSAEAYWELAWPRELADAYKKAETGSYMIEPPVGLVGPRHLHRRRARRQRDRIVGGEAALRSPLRGGSRHGGGAGDGVRQCPGSRRVGPCTADVAVEVLEKVSALERPGAVHLDGHVDREHRCLRGEELGHRGSLG